VSAHDRTDPEAVTLDAYWHDLVTAAMLGTDRRDPPEPPPGPVADLVDDALRPDGASRMLAAVGAVAAARRAAFVPGPPAATLHGPEADERPMCSPAAVASWRRVVAEWRTLEDEWVLTVIEQGLRLSPDALVGLLVRHRSDGVRRARVLLAGGPAATWLAGQFPELGAPSGRRDDVEAATSLPELPIPPELEALVDLDAHSFSSRLADGFESGAFGPPDRAVLVNLIARCRPAVLLDAAEALERTRVGHALALADMARLRHRMLTELGVRP
jgi:hypothetical protein